MTTAQFLDFMTASVHPLLRPAPLVRRPGSKGFETLLDMGARAETVAPRRAKKNADPIDFYQGDQPMKIHVIDTETTGLDPEKDRVVEFAAVEVREAEDTWVVRTGWQSFVDPGLRIPPEASAIHHIINADVAGAPSLDAAVAKVIGPDWPDGVDIVAAHNCRFDMGFLPMLKDKRWIDTYRCALHIWPDAPGHSNQTLRYWLGIDLPRDGAHRALSDATVTAHVLLALLGQAPVEELLILSTKAVVLRKVGFGKHFGKLWTEVPGDYLRWAEKQDFDPDVRFTVKSELTRRVSEF